MLSEFIIKKYIKEEDPDKNDLKTRERFGILSGIVGIIGNLTLSAAKFFAGVITGSIAISADASNNLSDAISSLVTLICFRTSSNPADREHPFGHGRIEYISGLIISIVIIFMGIEFLKSSIEKIFNPEPVNIGTVPIIILVISLIIKIWMGIFNTKISKKINSTAIKASASDSRNDAIITITILIGIAITKFTGIYVDAYAGIIVAAFIIYSGYLIFKETMDPLLGTAPDPDIIKSITNLVMKCPDILEIHDLAVHNYGPNKSVISLHAEVPANKNIIELHDSIDAVEKKLKKKFNCQATIHIDPIIVDDEKTNSMREKVSAMVKLINPSSKVYNFRIMPGKIETLIFHASFPYDFEQSDRELKKSIIAAVETIDPNYECIITIDRVYFES